MTFQMALCVAALLVTPQDQDKPISAKPAVATSPAAHTNEELLPIEMNIIKYTNAERAKHGLPPLAVDQKLMASARKHASWMARSRNLTHTSRSVGENIAMGQSHSSGAVRSWMNSPGHRGNILNRSYGRIGAAAYRTPGGTIYWCEQFIW